MKHLLIIAFVALFTCKASAQKAIKVKDATKYVGKVQWIEGRVMLFVGYGYWSRIKIYVETKTFDNELAVIIPMSVWSKSPKLASSTLKGKLVMVHGVIKIREQQPYLVIRDTTDVKIVK